jgi:hypothetical protein
MGWKTFLEARLPASGSLNGSVSGDCSTDNPDSSCSPFSGGLQVALEKRFQRIESYGR